MTVGVVLPVYNGAEYVAEAIESVLSQTYEDFELVVVDGGSIDGTREVVHSYDDPRVRLLETDQRQGVAAARNDGVAHTSRPLLAFIDHDDIWHPTKLARHVEMHRTREVDLVYSDIRKVAADGSVIEESSAPKPATNGTSLVRQLLIQGGSAIVTMSSVTVTRTAWTCVGGQDPDYPVSADIDFYVRLAGGHTFERLPEQLVDKRDHDDNISDDYEAIYEAHERILEKAMTQFSFLDESDERRKRARMAYRRATSALSTSESTEAVRFGVESLGHDWRVRPLLVVFLAALDYLAGPFNPGHRIFATVEDRPATAVDDD